MILSLQLCLLIIGFPRKHGIDMMHDVRLTNPDIKALTETYLLPQHSNNEIKETLEQYELRRQDYSADK